MTKPTLDELVKRLPLEKAALEAAEQRTWIARSDETERRTKLNATQKAIDAAVAELRKGAPRDTDWARSQGVPRHD